MSSAAEILAQKHGVDLSANVRKPQSRSKAFGEQSVFDLANGADTLAVLDRLGIHHEQTPRGVMATCPGCGEDGSLVCDGGGLKCFHDRCSHAGPPSTPGFRSNVDLVMQAERLEKVEAAKRICGWFAIGVPSRKREAHDTEPATAAPHNEAERVDAGLLAPLTIASVIEQWREQGPLVHEPTGIAELDELTGGGPVYGTRWYIAGAPDAGKTALLVQIAHVFLGRGIVVGLLAVDEEAADLVTRLAQRVGYSRLHCEARDPNVLAGMLGELEDLPVRFYDDRWTIESAAADLAGYAEARRSRAMLGIDSVQTVSCEAERAALVLGREVSEVQAVTARARAIRFTATRHRLIAIATSELGRGAYRSSDPSQQTSILASSKWSGAIEYSARVLLGLRNVPGESDLIDVELAKNKHGPQSRLGDGTAAHVFLRLDRRAQTLSPVRYDPTPPEEREAQRDERARARVDSDSERVLALVCAEPGITTRDLINAAKASHGMSRERVYAAVHALGNRIERRDGKRDAKHHYPAEASA